MAPGNLRMTTTSSEFLYDPLMEGEKAKMGKTADVGGDKKTIRIGRNVQIGFLAAATGGLLFGFVIGVSSGVVTTGALLCDDDDHASNATKKGDYFDVGYDLCYDMTDLEKGVVTSLNLIGAFVSTMFCLKYGERLGRHAELSISAVLYTIGSIGTALAPTLWSIYIGLLVYGSGIGFAMHAAPVYIAEIAHESSRGLLVSCKEAVIVVGMLIGYFVSWIFQNTTYNWRFMIASASVFSVLLGFFIATQKRSPRWLAVTASRSSDPRTRERLEAEVESSLRHFRSNASEDDVKEELRSIFESASTCDRDAVLPTTDNDDVVVSKRTSGLASMYRYRRALFIGCGLVVLQQITGQPSVLYYANNVFKSAGFGDNAAIASITVSVVKLIATIVSVLRVDRYGRRKLLFVGISMMLVALVVLSIGFSQQHCTTEGVSVADCSEDDLALSKTWGLATVLALMLYVSGYQVGFGPVSWVVISEIFPLCVRSTAFSIATASNFSANIAVAFLFSSLQSWLTASGAYVLYASLTVVSLLFTWFFVPETKGRTLEEIERILGY